MTRQSRIALVLAAALLLAACGGDPSTPLEGDGPPPPATVTLHPVQYRGGTPIEGYIAAWQVDAAEDALDGTQYRESTSIPLEPGERDLRVLVHPCDAVCTSWERFVDRTERQRETSTNTFARVELSIRRCERALDVDAGDRMDLTPVVVVGPGGEVCSIVDGAPDELPKDAVAGTVIARDDDVRICTSVFLSLPPTCGDVSSGPNHTTFAVEGLDLDDLPVATESEGGVTWTSDGVVLLGELRGDTLYVRR